MLKILKSSATVAAVLAGCAGILLILYAWDLPPFVGSVQTTDNAYVRGSVTLISPQLAGYVAEVAVQDFQEVKAGQLLVRLDDRIFEQKLRQARSTLAGAQRAKTVVEIDVPGHAAATVPLPAQLATADEPRDELLVADPSSGDGRAWWFFAEDHELRWPRAEYDATVEPGPDGVRVHVTARTILRDLILYPDRLDPSAVVDEALVTLLPGETATFTVRARAELDPAALTRRPVLRCVNDLVD